MLENKIVKTKDGYTVTYSNFSCVEDGLLEIETERKLLYEFDRCCRLDGERKKTKYGDIHIENARIV